MNLEFEYPNLKNYSQFVWEWAIVNYKSLPDYYKRWKEYKECGCKKLVNKEETLLGCSLFYGSDNKKFEVNRSKSSYYCYKLIKHHVFSRKESANKILTYIEENGMISWEEWLDIIEKYCAMILLSKDEHARITKCQKIEKNIKKQFEMGKIELIYDNKFVIDEKNKVKNNLIDKFFEISENS